jgi:hypothetical protein
VKPIIFCLLWPVLAAAAHAGEAERLTTLRDQQRVSVTIYNEDLALVKDNRRVELGAGENLLAWRDVSAKIRPETAHLSNTSHPEGFELIEQNFDFDLLTPAKLIQKNVGGKVLITKTNPATGVETTEEATILSANEGLVVQFADRVEIDPAGKLVFKAVPGNLRDRPTLVIRLQQPQSGVQNLGLSYLTSGLAWKADYVAELSANDDSLELNGWVTLTNQSGTSYPDAHLQLVAGDVNRVQEEIGRAWAKGAVMQMAAAPVPMKEEGLFEYHLYSLDRSTTIADNQTKQRALLSATGVPARKEFMLRGADYYYYSSTGEIGQKLKVGVYVEFDNKGQNLGIALPKGVVRVYKKDSAGNAQFVGEDRIDHTPKNETVRLKLGDAFDITADKKQTAFQKIAGNGKYNNIFEASFEVALKNAKNESVEVKVVEPIPGDWEIVSETAKHTKLAANTAVWKIRILPMDSTTLSYRARVKY